MKVYYVYGVVPAGFAPQRPASGIEDADVVVERDDDRGIAALVSSLDGSEYTPPRLDDRIADVAWLGPRAAAHDLVLTWASDRGEVVPLPMFSMFNGIEAVRRMLSERGPELVKALAHVAGAREYGIRLYRVDSELLGAVTTLSPRLAAMERAAREATPGQRYLLERKLDIEKRDEMRVVGRTIADELWNDLRETSRDAVRSPIPRVSAADAESAARGTMVLNAAFLVGSDALRPFQSVLTAFAERHEGRGFRVDFTGPWPPYHFVGQATERSGAEVSDGR